MFLLIFLLLRTVAAAEQRSQCASCATPMLKANWHITGLPTYPTSNSETFFDETCLFANPKRMTNNSCSGLCMEMTFPLDGVAQIVRGCYEDFFVSTRPPEEVEQCEFSIGNETTLIGITSTTTPVTSVRFCDWNKQDGIEACNGKFYTGSTPNAPGTLAGNREQIAIFCNKEVRTATLTCKSCSRYSGNGECSHKTSSTCSTGRYCVKVKGNAGSNQIDVRGCAQISPYPKTGSYCTRIKSQIGNNANFGLEPTKQEFDADVCFCNDRDSCNHSANVRVEIFLLLLISLLTYITSF